MIRAIRTCRRASTRPNYGLDLLQELTISVVFGYKFLACFFILVLTHFASKIGTKLKYGEILKVCPLKCRWLEVEYYHLEGDFMRLTFSEVVLGLDFEFGC